MPLYEYHCQACGVSFELLLRGAEEPACPECASRDLEKLLSVPAAHNGKGSELPLACPPSRGPCGMGGCGLPECE